jgi:hypothetical protein
VSSERVIERNKGNGVTLEFPVSTEVFEITDQMFEMPLRLRIQFTWIQLKILKNNYGSYKLIFEILEGDWGRL